MVILALLAVIGGPIIINECYKGDSGYITIWSAADTLSYYGTVLGALVAAATIAVTIIFTRKQLQRESFLKSETEKWSNIERIIASTLDVINPIRPLFETMDTGMTDARAAITFYQKYQMYCKTAMDRLIALLSSADYPKVKELLERISQSAEEFIRICDKEVAIYMMLRDFSGRNTAKDTLKTETGYPNLFSEDTLIFCRTLLDKTDGVTLDGLNEDIAAANRELACAYEKTYKSLLQLKGQTFEAIDVEMQKRANSLLDFKGKFEDKT